MTLEVHHIDAFTDRAFAGNPAAVCVLDGPCDEGWMQELAAELNLSETAFVTPRGKGFGLRWFTPRAEVDLCGHATLASAHCLWETSRLNAGVAANFETRSGQLTCVKNDGWIEMDFPAERAESCADAAMLAADVAAALGIQPRVVAKNRLHFLVELGSEREVRNVEPDFRKLAKLPARGLIVTARSESSEFDFVSRYFAPKVGVDEDPVTGSAHCSLGPYWSAKLGRTKLIGHQASRRGGVVRVVDRGARVTLAGQAVSVMRSELLGHATASEAGDRRLEGVSRVSVR